MIRYDVRSPRADDFINHQEILDTLAYAAMHRHDAALARSILEKARANLTPAHDHGTTLTHREASVLLACEDPEVNAEIRQLARDIKQAYYGNRIVLFAPLYLSNYCVNGCLYCPYHAKNRDIPRRKLTQEEIRAEVIALQDMGHKRLAIEAGEDPAHNPLSYILESLETIYGTKYKNGAIRREREHRRHDGGRLPPVEGRGNRHLHPVPGDLPPCPLRRAAPLRPQGRLRLAH